MRLRLDDLEPKDQNPTIDLSILMTIYGHRQAQMERTLETLARQSWRNFEVLIGHGRNISGINVIIETFAPFLHIKTFSLSPVDHQICPTLGFKTMIPHAQGKVIAIMQPEVMLHQDAAKALYFNHFETMEDTHYWRMNALPYSNKDRPRFVNFKVGFTSPFGTRALDGVDWHSDLRNVETGDFWTHRHTLSNAGNHLMLSYYEFPWWFVSSALADDPIWSDMPIFTGHATVDFWLLAYRRINNYVDACPLGFMGYHQAHSITATAPASDMVLSGAILHPDRSSWKLMDRLELAKECVWYGVVNLTGDEDEDTLRRYLLKAKAHTLTMVEQHRAIAVSSMEPPKLPMPWNLEAHTL